MKFEVKKRCGKARLGQMVFDRGTVRTPAFMPVGTLGTVKGLRPENVEELGADILLGNTFHLWLRPGTDVIKAHGDLHDFMNWKKPILTPSLQATKVQLLQILAVFRCFLYQISARLLKRA